MNPSAIFTLILTLLSAVFLIAEWLRPDLIALCVMVILGLCNIVGPKEVFSGFSGSAVMTILGISIISAGLHQTGVATGLGRLMRRLGGQSDWRLILVVTLTSATLSLFMNNIAAVGVLLPAVMSLSRHSQNSPSRLLMPLAFGTSLGGMATLLTTSNIIVSGTLRTAGFRGFGLLDFFPIGAPIVLLGALYLITFGRRLLPGKQSVNKSEQREPLQKELTQLYRLHENLLEVEVLPSCRLANQSIAETGWGKNIGLSIIAVLHEQQTRLNPLPEYIIRPGDRLLVLGNAETDTLEGLRLRLIAENSRQIPISDETITLAELIVAPHCSLIGDTLHNLHFREKFELNVLAIWRESRPIQKGIAEMPLRFGDALLVHGPASRIETFSQERNLILLEKDPDAVLKPSKRWLAIIITLVTLTIAALGILSTAEVVIAGAVLMLITRCIEINDAYQAIEWKAIFLIAGMWSLSIAISSTGLADQVIRSLSALLGAIPPLLVAGILTSLACLFSQFMSGQVASLVLAPLAISAASYLGIHPYGLGMATALGCSLTFPTPFGHPVNIMVMSPGGYTFKDYFRVGLPLTLLAFAAILFGLHLFWGL